jgi:hypothetical protein
MYESSFFKHPVAPGLDSWTFVIYAIMQHIGLGFLGVLSLGFPSPWRCSPQPAPSRNWPKAPNTVESLGPSDAAASPHARKMAAELAFFMMEWSTDRQLWSPTQQ